MELKSDYNQIKHFMLSDDINQLELSEMRPEMPGMNLYQTGGMRRYKFYQVGGQDNGLTASDQSKKIATLDEYEKDFYAIFNKAKAHQLKLKNIMNGGADDTMYGGAEPAAKKAPGGPTFAILTAVAKLLHGGGEKYPNIKYSSKLKIAKLIVDDAKTKLKLLNVKPLTDADAKKIHELAEKLTKDDPDYYVNIFLKTAPPGSLIKKSRASTKKSRASMKKSRASTGKTKKRAVTPPKESDKRKKIRYPTVY
jgi:hypothetical protein